MNHRRTIGFFLGTLALGSALTLVVQRVRAAGVPATVALTYTGYLESPDGTPVNGSKPIALYIYDAATAGTILCQVVSGSPTTLTSGRFQILLSEACTAAVKANPDLYVEVQVEGLALGRTKLGAVPYAVEAGHAMAADSASNAAHAAAADSAAAATTAAKATTADTATKATTADSAIVASGLSPEAVTGNTKSGQLATGQTLPQTVTLAGNGTYILSTTLWGAWTDVHQTYLVHVPGTPNLNLSLTALSMANDYDQGSIAVRTQDGGPGYGGNANANYAFILTFATGSYDATWTYSLTRLL